MARRSTGVFKQFVESEKSGGLTLIFFTIISLILANSSFGKEYIALWDVKFAGMNIEHWVNDALMAIFFLLIGLELKREFREGELSSIKQASLPVVSALGGMLVPATIYAYFNNGLTTSTGFGIPMATDIAFALGILSLLGNRVPLSLKIFLTALAVIDDLGAILVIALFYTKTIIWLNIGISLGIFGLLLVLNKLKVTQLWIYLPLGIVMWYFMHHSGIHATITGVLFAFALPSFSFTKRKSASEIVQKVLHYPVPFIILPIFAIVNTSVLIGNNWQDTLAEPYSLGIILGLVVGKPIGIFLFSYLSVKLKIASKPNNTRWSQLFGVGILGGIGFTMSIFVTLLAFGDAETINGGKITILCSSVLAALIGLGWLYFALPKKKS